MNLVVLLLLTMAVQNCFAGFSFSNKTSQIKVSSGSTFTIDGPIGDFVGTLAIDNGGRVTGNTIQFADGVLVDSQTPLGAIQGSFACDFNTPYIDNINLTGNQSVMINGEVSVAVTVSGPLNVVNGSPIFTQDVQLDPDFYTELHLGINTECGVNINLAGNTLILDQNLTLAPNCKISSSTSRGLVCLNGHTISFGPFDDALTDVLYWEGRGSIALKGTVAINNTWRINGEVDLVGQGNSLDLAAQNANLIIASNSTLRLDNITLKGITSENLYFTDITSKLILADSQLTLSANYNQNTGVFMVVSESKILMGSHEYEWIFSDAASFVNTSLLWLDTGLNDMFPTFGFLDDQNVLTTYVDNETVKQTVDFEKVRDMISRYLVSGSVNHSVHMANNLTVQAYEAINFTGDCTITSEGANINFDNTADPQLIVNDGVTATLAGEHTLSVYSNTIDIKESGTLEIAGDTKVVVNDNVSLPTGSINIAPGGTLNLSGTGSGQRIELSSVPGMQPAALNIGYGDLILNNADFYGISQVTKSKTYVNNTLREGRVVMSGNTRINIEHDTDMNIHISGANNIIVLKKNYLTLSGHITFEDSGDNILEIRFETSTEEDQLTVSFAKNTMHLASIYGIARLHFNDYDVLLHNLHPDAFIAGGHSFLNGQYLRIADNSIKQISTDLTLGRDLSLLTSGGLVTPTLISTARTDLDFLTRQGTRFAKSFSFPNLPEFEHYFINRSLCRAPRRPSIRIPGAIDSRTTRGVVRVQRYGQISNFGIDGFDALELQLSGNSRVKPPVRRVKRTTQNLRAINIPNFNDSEYTDKFKTTDAIYVSGQDNRIIISGNLEIQGSLVLDEGAELIFEFDDSIDSAKAIRFATTTQEGEKGFAIPKSASVVFQGSGQVIFQDGTQVFFQGDGPTLVNESFTQQIFNDNRPSLIFKNYAEFAVDLGEQISMLGKGQILVQNNSSLRISNGQIIVGNSVDDIFNITADRLSTIKIGNFDATDLASAAAANARFSLCEGLFSVNFDHQSQLQVRSDGIFEALLDTGVYQAGHVEQFKLTGKSTLDIGAGGRLALAQEFLSDASSLESQFGWDNQESVVQNGGVISLYSSLSSAPVLEAVLQDRKFSVTNGSALAAARNLIRQTSGSGLIDAADFTDTAGQYKLLLRNNVVVNLQDGDIMRREDPVLGTVFGTDAQGVKFAILTSGQRQALS